MTAERLIELLEERRVLPERLVEKLRAKVSDSERPMTAAELAKFLVQKRHISEFQASELLADLPADIIDEGDPERPTTESVAPSPPESSGMKSGFILDGADEEEPVGSSIFSSLLPSQSKLEPKELSLKEEPFPLTPADEVDDEDARRSAADLARVKLAPIHDFEQLSATKQSREDPKLMEDPLEPDVYLSASSKSLRSPSSIMRNTRKAEDRVRKKIEKKIAKKAADKGGAVVKKKPRRGKEWESPFFLIGAGVLALLIVSGVAVWMLYNWQSGDRILAIARDASNKGAFQPAIEQYDEFLRQYPRHADASAARVELGMIRLRQASEGGTSEAALKVAKNVLPNIENEAKFAQVRDQLAKLLPQIAHGLANQAEAATENPAEAQRLVDAATEALGLCNTPKYVSKEFRDDAALAAIDETLARVSQRQKTRAELDSAVSAMKSAVESGDTRAAYAAHKQIMHEHPELAANEQLAELVVATSAAEKAGVKFIVDEQLAETNERPTPWVAMLATGNRHAGAISATGGTFCTRIDGAVYGFDVTNGRILWRRYVGLGTAPPPQTVGENILVPDSNHQELLRLDGRTGKLIWRQSFGEPFAAPLVVGGRAYVAAESGRLFVIDLDTGSRMGYLQFAQPLRTTPSVDRGGQRLYLTGDHSSIYTISLQDLTCSGVYYLGHASGTIRVSPAQVVDKLAVIENDGVATCRLRLLALEADGTVAKSQAERRLAGLASAPPMVAGRRLVVVTDRGELDAFDVAGGEGKQSLTPVAKRDPTSQRPILRHVAMTQSAIWVGDTQLTKFGVQPTGDRLPVESIDNSFVGATFDGPFGVFGSTLVHVRRPSGRAGVIVGAMDADAGKSLWETELAMAPIATPTVNDTDRTLTMVDVNGDVFRFDAEAVKARVQDQPLSAKSTPVPLPKMTAGIDLGGGRAAFAAPRESEQMLLYDPAAPRDAARWIRLPSKVACAAAPLGKGALVPLEVGQVFYLDPSSGEPLAAPFQPRLQPRMKVDYQPPCQADSAGRQFVITDGREKIYLVGLNDQPKPHLTTIAEATVGPSALVSAIFVIGQNAVAVTANNQLARFELPSLKAAGSSELPGEVVWGPHRVGELLVMGTADERLVALKPNGEIAWNVAEDGGDLAGPPLATKDGLLIAYRKGTLERRALANGEPLAKLEVEHPLAAGPVRFLQRIVLTAHDGTLLVVEEP